MNIVKIFCEFSNMHIKPGNAPDTETTCFPAEVHFPDVFFQSDPVYREAYEADARPFPGQSGRHLRRRCLFTGHPYLFSAFCPTPSFAFENGERIAFQWNPTDQPQPAEIFYPADNQKEPPQGSSF